MAENGIKGIVFFDGVCGLCNGFVNFLMRRKHASNFRFSTLQGETARELLPTDLTAELKSVVYYKNNTVYLRSSAALHILADLGGLWVLARVFLLVPGFLRNGVYDWIGRNRYNWFGKKDNCRIPSREERALFLN